MSDRRLIDTRSCFQVAEDEDIVRSMDLSPLDRLESKNICRVMQECSLER